MPIDVQSATRYNRQAAQRLGWRERFGQIVDLLGFRDRTPDEAAFAIAVAEWQQSRNNGAQPTQLKIDGKLGPNTWRAMQPLTNFSPSYAAPRPPWLGTSAAPQQPRKGPQGLDVSKLDTVDKYGEAIRRSLPHVAPEVREEIEKLLAPETLAIVAGVLVAWGASHYIGIGEIIDVVILIVGVAAIGIAFFDGLDELFAFSDRAVNARSEADLEQAGKHFANAIAILGIQTVLAILFRGSPKTFSPKGARPSIPRPKKIRKNVAKDPRMQPGQGSTTAWGEITVSPHGTAADVRLATIHEKVHRLLTPKVEILRQFRVEARVSSYFKSALRKYLEEALAETVAQVGVNGFKAAFSGITFPVKNGYVTVFQKSGDAMAVLPEVMGLVVAGFYVSGIPFGVAVSSTHPKPRPAR